MDSKQRVAVARALANRPSVILADEPTAALDSERGRQVMELFAQVAHQQGAGVIVVTHDQRALDVFDTIYEMEDGLMQRQSQVGLRRAWAIARRETRCMVNAVSLTFRVAVLS